MMDSISHIIFDLDGTLIDSAPAILETFQGVLEKNGIEPRVTINSQIIGPPLIDALRCMTGYEDQNQLIKLAEEFKQRYDSDGVYHTHAYPGVIAMLDGLMSYGYKLHIATNKRAWPTGRVLEHLDLARYFVTVYSIDRVEPPYNSKQSMISALLGQQNISAELGCYVGDKYEDGLAADANKLAFVAAEWGYGEWGIASRPNHWESAALPSMLMKQFAECY